MMHEITSLYSSFCSNVAKQGFCCTFYCSLKLFLIVHILWRICSCINCLLLIYMHVHAMIFTINLSLLFADDTNIFCSHRDTDHLVSIVKNELAKNVKWYNQVHQ